MEPGAALALEDALVAIDGVIAAVVIDGPGPGEVQVFVAEGADTSAIRDSAEKLAAEQGIAAEVQVLEVVLDLGAARARRGGPSLRPQLRSIVLVDDTTGVPEAQVTLRIAGREHEGTSRTGRSDLVRAVNATLSALGDLLAGPARVRTVQHMDVDGAPAVVVLIEHGGLTLLGSGLVGDGPLHRAAVRATLDAVNRRLGLSPAAAASEGYVAV